ncbi:chemotaxis protein CheW [Saccharibacillus sp. CPCC 101409]|uniref:chemotaxis protein CheW n=1 Tax=Saccharibacillus sp. CPCC 101409 TaxID=3058041 RepID=UPI002672516C|nr:chemotaxis protein CheW [Saccharibacillus sp. CPCC 101409]MDO3412289.1 chemotaxis protein CheW [Saccharibacillus sp. CPCC 101409]
MFNPDSEQYVVFKIEGEEYGIPIESVHQILPVPDNVPVSDYYSAVHGMMKIAGKIMPVFDVHFAFGFDEPFPDPRQRLIVIREGRLTVALLVDEVTEVLKTGQEQPEVPSGVRRMRKGGFFTGMYRTPERIVLLFDLRDMLEEEGLELN